MSPSFSKVLWVGVFALLFLGTVEFLLSPQLLTKEPFIFFAILAFGAVSLVCAIFKLKWTVSLAVSALAIIFINDRGHEMSGLLSVFAMASLLPYFLVMLTINRTAHYLVKWTSKNTFLKNTPR